MDRSPVFSERMTALSDGSTHPILTSIDGWSPTHRTAQHAAHSPQTALWEALEATLAAPSGHPGAGGPDFRVSGNGVSQINATAGVSRHSPFEQLRPTGGERG